MKFQIVQIINMFKNFGLYNILMSNEHKNLKIEGSVYVNPMVYKVLIDIQLLKLKSPEILSALAEKIGLAISNKNFRDAVDLIIEHELGYKSNYIQSSKILHIDSKKLANFIEKTNMWEITARYIRSNKLIYDGI